MRAAAVGLTCPCFLHRTRTQSGWAPQLTAIRRGCTLHFGHCRNVTGHTFNHGEARHKQTRSGAVFVVLKRGHDADSRNLGILS